MSRAGYDIGTELGNIMNHNFISKPAKIVAGIGRVVGMLVLSVFALIALGSYGAKAVFDGEGNLIWPSIIIAFCGALFLAGMHWTALKIDKNHEEKNS